MLLGFYGDGSDKNVNVDLTFHSIIIVFIVSSQFANKITVDTVGYRWIQDSAMDHVYIIPASI